MEGDQDRQNCGEPPVIMMLYRPGSKYRANPVTGPPYPIQVGADLQQAHHVETDDMSMLGGTIEPQYAQVLPQSISRGNTMGLPFPEQHSANGSPGIGDQSASGFSNYGMNVPERGNIQALPSTGSQNGDGGRMPLWQAPSLSDGLSGIGRQPASGFSNAGLNYFGRGHLQGLPGTGNGSQPVSDVGNGGNLMGMDSNKTELQKKLKSEIKDYDKKTEKCIQSFLDIGKDRHCAEANGMELKYFTNVEDMVQCLQCRSQAGNTDKFHHHQDCMVLKVMKDIGYSSSDEDSLSQRSDSDESMESEEDGTRNILSGENTSAAGFNTAGQSMTGFQTLRSDDSLFRSAGGTNILLPSDDQSMKTVSELWSMGFGEDRIKAVFEIQGQKCLQSAEEFLRLEEMCPTASATNSCDSNLGASITGASVSGDTWSPCASNLGASITGASVSGATWSTSSYATAADYPHRGAPVQNFATRLGGGDVFVPPTVEFSPRGSTVEVTGDADISLDYLYCLGCDQEQLACVNQKPCGHVVCKTCGDKSNRFCKVCQKSVTHRGVFDLGSFGV